MFGALVAVVVLPWLNEQPVNRTVNPAKAKVNKIRLNMIFMMIMFSYFLGRVDTTLNVPLLADFPPDCLDAITPIVEIVFSTIGK